MTIAISALPAGQAISWASGAGNIVLGQGTTTLAPLAFTGAGSLMTTPSAGAAEFDAAQFYATIDTSSSRGAIPVEQYFHLTANGGTISTIANFFGANSNINLVASAHYIIDIEAWMSVQTGGQTATWTLTNSVAPTSQNIDFQMSPVTGIVAPPGTATMLQGQFQADATSARTIVTAALTASAVIYTRMRIWLINSTGTSLKIQLTSSAATLTPLVGSWWRCRRVSPNNIGSFAA